MADAKVSALTALTPTQVAADDSLYVVDTSAGTAGSKRIEADDLLDALVRIAAAGAPITLVGGAALTLQSPITSLAVVGSGNTITIGANTGYAIHSSSGIIQFGGGGQPAITFQIYAGGNLYGIINANSQSYLARGLLVGNVISTDIPLVAQGAPSQSANLTEWKSSAAAVYGTVSENGYFTTRKNTAPDDEELVAREAAWWFDSTDGASKLRIKAKTADGTVVAGSITLT